MGILVELLLLAVFGIICAALAADKGRNPVGWFFIGFFLTCIGIVLVLVVSNLKEQERQIRGASDERRRLREQVRQERIKNESFRDTVDQRLDTHDDALGIDTRPPVLPADRLTHDLAGSSAADTVGFHASLWFVHTGGTSTEEVDFEQLRDWFHSDRVNRGTLVWRSGMEDWKPIEEVPDLVEELS